MTVAVMLQRKVMGITQQKSWGKVILVTRQKSWVTSALAPGAVSP